MPPLQILLPFVVACFVVTAVPGISVSAMVGATLARGLGAGLWQEMGAQLGRLSVVLVVALALQLVTGLMAAAFDIIKYAGAAYLVWLGWGYLTKRHSITVGDAVAARRPARLVLSGFLVIWSNPKALIFFGAFLPQFVDPRYPAWPQVIVLGLIEMFAALVTDGGYILLAAFARNALTGRSVELVNRVAGVILIGAAVWLALQHQA
ncbi:MAG TPA: LysE family translocator [Devosiaceae bacterium]|jgi:threonine/homoserine/homoserine lactone efflux protein|nr:LysE family translocator [Devosiaceae bacterium]